MDAPGNDGNVSMQEQVRRTNPWRNIMIIIIIALYNYIINAQYIIIFLIKTYWSNAIRKKMWK